MFVLVEAHEQSDTYKAQELWMLLSDVYAAHIDLLVLADDKRKFHAAELVVTAWNAHQSKTSGENLETPDFVVEIANKLAEYCTSVEEGNAETQLNAGNYEAPSPLSTDEIFAEGTFEFDINLQDIDWGFWSSID
jgi:hypothetical protein